MVVCFHITVFWVIMLCSIILDSNILKKWQKNYKINLGICRVQPTRCNVSQFYSFPQDTLHVSDSFCAHQELKTAHTASRICQTNTWCCMCSFELQRWKEKPSETCTASYTEINKILKCCIFWLYSANILVMHGPMNVKPWNTLMFKQIYSKGYV